VEDNGSARQVLDIKLSVPTGFFSLRGVRRLCQEADIEPSKALGQNFLFQGSVLRAMVRDLQLEPGTTVIEIGCGFGHLTVPLLEAGYRVIAFETDARLYRSIARFSAAGLEAVHSDVRSCDLSQWLGTQPRLAVVGNLPYSSAVSILFHLLDWYSMFSVWGFLLQREVGERITASPGDRRYGRLSVMLQYLFEVRILRRVGPACFHPRPQVESVWIRMLPRENADIDLALSSMGPLVKAAFSHRRKKISANLAGASLGEFRLAKDQIRESLRAVGVTDDCRAEELSPAQYASLAQRIRQLGSPEGVGG